MPMCDNDTDLYNSGAVHPLSDQSVTGRHIWEYLDDLKLSGQDLRRELKMEMRHKLHFV